MNEPGPGQMYDEALSLHRGGNIAAAIDLYQKVIVAEPENAIAWNMFGIAMIQTGKFAEALQYVQRAIAIRPDVADFHDTLGHAFQGLEKLPEAVGAWRKAVLLNPDHLKAHLSLGNALWELGEFAEAIGVNNRALELDPKSVVALNNLGNALQAQRKFEAAIAAYRRAIALEPRLAEAYVNLAVTFKLAGSLDEAESTLRQALILRPRYAPLHCTLGGILKETGRIQEAIRHLRQALELIPNYQEAHSNLIYAMYHDFDSDAKTIAEECRRWNQRHSEPLVKFIKPWSNKRDPDRRLRIGYVSADFKRHASAHFLRPLLRLHDRSQFEVFCYAQVASPDDRTAEFQGLADHWRSTVGVPDEEAAEQIREDQIDLLVDLKLHTAEHRLLIFSRKPAPVQVSWLGYPGDTGLTTIDYRLSDPYLDPPGIDESIYTGRTVRLPETFWCYEPLDRNEIAVNSLPAVGSGFVTLETRATAARPATGSSPFGRGSCGSCTGLVFCCWRTRGNIAAVRWSDSRRRESSAGESNSYRGPAGGSIWKCTTGSILAWIHFRAMVTRRVWIRCGWEFRL